MKHKGCPTSCPERPLGEIRRSLIFCRFYRLSTMLDYDRRPDYCRVEKIIIEEGDHVD